MSTQTRAKTPTPIPTSAPVERLGDVVAVFVLVAADADVATVGGVVMLICPALEFEAELKIVDKGLRKVDVARLCPASVPVNV